MLKIKDWLLSSYLSDIVREGEICTKALGDASKLIKIGRTQELGSRLPEIGNARIVYDHIVGVIDHEELFEQDRIAVDVFRVSICLVYVLLIVELKRGRLNSLDRNNLSKEKWTHLRARVEKRFTDGIRFGFGHSVVGL